MLSTNLLSGGTIPADPSTNRTYGYAYHTADNASYLLGVALESANNSVFNGYTAPATGGYTWVVNSGLVAPNTACTGAPTTGGGAASGATFCVSL